MSTVYALFLTNQVDNLIDTSLYITVGPDNYYLPYEVMVQAVNEKGRGPNSTVAIVYSAEDGKKKEMMQEKQD